MPHEVDTNELLMKLSELQTLYKSMTQDILSEHQISASALNLIDILGEEKATLKSITEKSQLDKSTISRQMNNLVKKELVIKTTGEDKRYAYFALAEDAKGIYSTYNQTFKEQFSGMLAGWTEEEKHLLSVLLGRLNRSMTNGLKNSKMI
ncbi:MarR family transcriptional regulator [Marinilactibacillus sp. XAAS-LB27]|uniref:MarR family winged helix-turn-helix transcriptional regulator n=1 Tax=Marinilactibacillus sp. XAAS-LB27 TaxID=3114538 RepID=UPI002E19396D|nr:MarR family transcriptional regulator [Marinilactibacillus sp. XAAS-LB27]